MGRSPRIVIPGAPHHVTQRGNYRQDVFRSDLDRYDYLNLFRRFTRAENIHVLAYCLMTNHVHAILVPPSEQSVPRLFRVLQSTYTRHLNNYAGRSGHLWHSRYFCKPLDSAHVCSAIRYVECNPLRAGMVERAEEYHWSSAVAHVWNVDMRGILDMPWWWNASEGLNWRAFLDAGADTDPESIYLYQAATAVA